MSQLRKLSKSFEIRDFPAMRSSNALFESTVGMTVGILRCWPVCSALRERQLGRHHTGETAAKGTKLSASSDLKSQAHRLLGVRFSDEFRG